MSINEINKVIVLLLYFWSVMNNWLIFHQQVQNCWPNIFWTKFATIIFE